MRADAPAAVAAPAQRRLLAWRRVAGDEVVQCRWRGAGDVHAGGAQVFDHLGRQSSRKWLRAAAGILAPPAPPAAHRGKPRHLEKFQRRGEPVGIDLRALLQFANVPFGKR